MLTRLFFHNLMSIVLRRRQLVPVIVNNRRYRQPGERGTRGPLTFGLLPVALLSVAAHPMFQVPNPFCNIFNIIRDWLGGIIVISVAMVAVGLFLRQFAAERFGHNVTNGIFSIAAGIFILGLLLTNNGQGIEAIAQALGLTLTISCP